MLSQNFYDFIGKVFPVMYRLGVLNFNWYQESQNFRKMSYTSNLFKGSITMLYIWEAFLILKTITTWLQNDHNISNIVLPFAVLAAAVFVFVNMVNQPDNKFILGINSVLYYVHRINRSYLQNNKDNMRKTEQLVESCTALLTVCTGGVFCGFVMFCALFPRFPSHLGSEIPDHVSTVFLVPAAIFHCWICIPIYGNVYVLMLVCMVYTLVVLPFVCKNLRLGRQHYNSCPTYRSVNRIGIEYQSAVILQRLFNDVVGMFIVPLQVLMALTFYKGTTTVLLHFISTDIFPLVMLITVTVFAPGAYILFLFMGAYLYRNGNQILSSWKSNEITWHTKMDRLFMRKLRLACRPISVNYQNIITVKPQSVLDFVNRLLEGLIGILLAVKFQ